MVTLRCKMIVKSELENMGLHYTKIELGEVEITEELSTENYHKLNIALLRTGLELMDDKRSVLIEKIKSLIIEMVHYSDEAPQVNYSQYISEKLHYEYNYLSNIFSQVKGVTIEHFIILHKIERVKELIIYDELSLSEISYKLGYSSVGHLSRQFKKTTGLTPTFFKSMKSRGRTPLDEV